jgi:hypothetical protein
MHSGRSKNQTITHLVLADFNHAYSYLRYDFEFQNISYNHACLSLLDPPNRM